ncbi:MAG: tetratricopeptide repeat protein [Caldilineaceae bacterium]|nr:tetratricopeptide repeat protein [Caldilineaceae bacterium]
MADTRLALVVAPAGYGKTSMLLDWTEAEDTRAICWYTVDVLDEDPPRFLAHWIAAIRHRFPRFGLESEAALQSFAEKNITLDQLVAIVVNELYDTVQDPFSLIIDDYHLVDGVTEIGYFVSRFVQHVAANCQVVLASRKLLTLPNLALLVAHSQVVGIDDAMLAFTPREVQELARIRFSEEMSDQEANALAEATEGWITGILLSGHSTAAQHRVNRMARSTGVALYDYLAQQVLERQSPVLRAFLMRTAALEEFDAALCADIFPEEWLPDGLSWQMLVDEVLQKGLFVTAVGDDGTWLRFHRLFQEFLLYRLSLESPDEEALILQSHAHWLQERGEYERAYHLYQRLQDQEAVARLISQCGQALIAAGRAQLVDKWTASLPASFLTTYPEIISIRAAAFVILGQVVEGHRLLDDAISRLEPGENLWYFRSLAWRAVVLRYLGDYDAALAAATAALESAPDYAGPEQDLAEISANCYKTIAICHQRLGDLPQALEVIDKALELFKIAGSLVDVAKAQIDMALIHLSLGDLTNALETFEIAADSLRRSGHVQQLSLVLNNLGLVYHKRGQLILAVETLMEALSGAERSAHRRTETTICATLGDVLMDLGFPSAAQTLCLRSVRLARETTYGSLEIYANLQLAQIGALGGEAEQTFYHLDQVSKRIVEGASLYDKALYQQAVGRIHLLHNQPAMAVEVLLRARDYFSSTQHLSEDITTSLLLAAAYSAAGDADNACTHFQTVLDALPHMEYNYSVYAAAQPMLKWLAEIEVADRYRQPRGEFIVRTDEAMRQTRVMRRALRHQAPDGLGDLLAVKPALEVRALGRTEVILHGRYVTNSDWQTLVSRDLLYCLIAHPEGLTREEIGLIFWPKASPDQVKSRFKNSIYRLRKAIGGDIVIYEDDLYRFNQDLDYASDVEDFQTALARAAATTDLLRKSRALGHAIENYQGEFCPEIDDDWAQVERRHLDRRYRDALMELALLYLTLEQHADVLATCDRMIGVDACWEEAYRLSMRAYHAMGDRAAIVRQYDACHNALYAEVAAPPSLQTEDLYEQLMM